MGRVQWMTDCGGDTPDDTKIPSCTTAHAPSLPKVTARHPSNPSFMSPPVARPHIIPISSFLLLPYNSISE